MAPQTATPRAPRILVTNDDGIQVWDGSESACIFGHYMLYKLQIW